MQGINVFASTAARDAAITSPQEGQFAFTKDTNSLWYYDGAAWVASGATGDIEGVTAGIGISGGGTSGTVTVTNSMATAIDAKGDLVAGTGADAFSRIGVGANNTVLTADSAEATGLKWSTPASGSMTSVASGTLSGTAVAITGIPSTYKNLQLVITNYRPTTDNQSLRLRVNNDSTASSYMQDWASSNSAFGSTLWNIASDVDNGASQGIIVVDIYAYNDATWKLGFVRSINNNATTSTSGSYYMSFLYYNNTTTISQLNLFNSGGGNFTSGNYVVYGVN
jgi:hypothetical protein